jgi:cytoskeletal protein RodZ
MKINKPKKKSSKKILTVTLVVAILIAVGAGAYFLFSPKDEQNTKNSTGTTNSQSKSADSSTEETGKNTTNTDDADHEAEKNITPSYEGENTNTSQTLTGVINYAGVTNGTLIIRTTVNQALSSGTCQLTLSSGSKTATRSSNITQNPSSSTCEGFDIPISELGSGSWNITITITSGDRSGELKGNVTI